MSPLTRFPSTLVVSLLLWFGAVTASSSPARPLKRLAHPSTHALEILPRRLPAPNARHRRSSQAHDSPVLRHDDTFRLTLAAFDDTFHLHLRPNDHLVHPSARINYYRNGPDGKAVLDRTEPLLRERVRAYWGEVVHADRSPARMKEDAAGVVHRPVESAELGWARIMVHHQGDIDQGIPPIFEGAFSVNGVAHHILTKENYLRNKHAMDPLIVLADADPDSQLVIFRDSDVMSHAEEAALAGRPINIMDTQTKPRTCSHDSLAFNRDPWRNPVLRKTTPTPWYDALGIFEPIDPWENETYLQKRDDVAGGGASSNFIGSIGQTAGCSQTQKVVYMGVAADCQYTMRYGSTQNATTQILNDWNSASALYKTTFNVSLGILHLDVNEATCPSPPDTTRPWNVDCGNVTLNDRLSLFSQWRGTLGDDGAGLWHLMSGCPTGTEVGVAWLGTLCQQTASGDAPSIVSGTAVSTNGRTEWQVVSHEIGHNFGAIHDCQDGCSLTNTTMSCCPLTTNSCDANDDFIMSPVTSSSQSQFSQCSLGNICSLMIQTTQNSVNATCLQDPDPARQTISLQMCGNGIVENGEDCDPGQGVSSSCCDATTCKFAANAVCDPASSACCTTGCQYAPPTQVCRPSMDATCDTQETCTGNSSACPADVFAANGLSCGTNGLACANGHCTSESLQCQIVGASMNLSTACPRSQDNSCQVSCQDPSSSNQCVQLQSQLVDGSPCGFGGTCMGGNCQAGSALDTAKAWYVQNLQISIPVTVVVGIVAILLLWLSVLGIWRCCRRRKARPVSEPPLRSSGRRLSNWQLPPGGSPFAPQRLFIPPVLRSGSNESFSTAPLMTHVRGGSWGSAFNHPAPSSPRNASWDGTYGASRGRVSPPAYLRPPSGERRDQSRWVDASQWNGTVQR